MKKLALAVVLSAAASTAFAGSMEEPMIEAPVIVEETTSSSNPNIIIPILLIGILAAVAA